MLGRALALDVPILCFHPCLPVSQSLLAVALEAATQA
jgi:hypothetical protein